MRGWAACVAALIIASAHARPVPLGARVALLGKGHIQACAVCHGAKGQGRRHFDYPRLAGLSSAYLLDTMRAFADGRRLNGIMTPIARGLSPREVGAVANYYADLPAPIPSIDRSLSPVRLAEGRRLYEHGDLAERLPACARCHGVSGEGQGARFPRLAGQSAAYLKEQLRSFRAGARRGLGLGLMRAAVRPLDNRQIGDVALYLSVMDARPSPPLRPEAPYDLRIIRSHGFTPPRRWAVPATLFGQAVLHGRAIFDHTGRYARHYVRSALSCNDCHLGGGRLAHAGPLWAAAALYPRLYRGHITTLAARIQAAFRHNEGGPAPHLKDSVLTDLLAYVHWMSRGVPIGAHVSGGGYPHLQGSGHPPDAAHGAVLYVRGCAVCHGEMGQGRRYNGRLVFPPVWGPLSFRRDASLGQRSTLAAFLEATMPYGKPRTLSASDAYDLAAFLEGRPRPAS